MARFFGVNVAPRHKKPKLQHQPLPLVPTTVDTYDSAPSKESSNADDANDMPPLLFTIPPKFMSTGRPLRVHFDQQCSQHEWIGKQDAILLSFGGKNGWQASPRDERGYTTTGDYRHCVAVRIGSAGMTAVDFLACLAFTASLTLKPGAGAWQYDREDGFPYISQLGEGAKLELRPFNDVVLANVGNHLHGVALGRNGNEHRPFDVLGKGEFQWPEGKATEVIRRMLHARTIWSDAPDSYNVAVTCCLEPCEWINQVDAVRIHRRDAAATPLVAITIRFPTLAGSQRRQLVVLARRSSSCHPCR